MSKTVIPLDNQVHIFLFVNPLAGSRQGKKILDFGYKLVTFELSNHLSLTDQSQVNWRRANPGDASNLHVNMHIVDLIQGPQKE
jgi:hypothetical protein